MVATPPNPLMAGSKVDWIPSKGMPLMGMSPALVLAVTAGGERASAASREVRRGPARTVSASVQRKVDAVGERDGREECLVRPIVERDERTRLGDGENEIRLHELVSSQVSQGKVRRKSRTSFPVETSERTTSCTGTWRTPASVPP